MSNSSSDTVNEDEEYSDADLVVDPQDQAAVRNNPPRPSSSESSDFEIGDDDDRADIRESVKRIKKTRRRNNFRYPQEALDESLTFEYKLKKSFEKSLTNKKVPKVFTNLLEIDEHVTYEAATEKGIEAFGSLYSNILKQRSHDGTLIFLL